MMTTYHKPSATAVNIVGYSYASIVADAIANGLANDPGYQFTCNSEAFIYDNDLTGSWILASQLAVVQKARHWRDSRGWPGL
jgi:hypothetical protein